MTKLEQIKVERRTVLKIGIAGAASLSLSEGSRSAPSKLATPSDGLGQRVVRSDAALKVQGGARYAIEQNLSDMAYGVVIQSTRPAGSLAALDVTAAKAAPGVIAIYSHDNPLTIGSVKMTSDGGAATETFIPLRDSTVKFNGQHIAIVIADTFENATAASRLVSATYKSTEFVADMKDALTYSEVVDALTIERGDPDKALSSADIVAGGTYRTPRQYNVPMEPHGCIAAWNGDELTVWEGSQWVGGARSVIAQWMLMDIDKVRVVSPFVGGGFGSKVAPHPHVALACAAARRLGRPIKVVLTRQQTFTGFGGRPATRQDLKIAAMRDGRIVAITQESWNETSLEDDYLEIANKVTSFTYASPNVRTRHHIVPINTVTPGWMRAPGETPSAFALESAMDELAHELSIDPIELRLRNWADHDQDSNLPWTTRNLRQAYEAGAAAFGWSNRSTEPRSMRNGRELIGYGMAGGTYGVVRTPSEARAIAHADGHIEIQSSGTDLGTGTYTILAQTAADVLGLPTSAIKVYLGDTSLPRAPMAGGSQLANLLVGVVHKAVSALRDELLSVARTHPGSPFVGADAAEIDWSDGTVKFKRRMGSGLTISQLLRAVGQTTVAVHRDTFKQDATEDDRNSADRTVAPILLPTSGGVSAHSWSAHFVEVRVDEDFGTVRVKRMVGAFDSGRLYNPKLAESQWIGGMIMGLGQALLEGGTVDPRDGRVVNANLADYVVPVNLDVPEISVLSVGEPDYKATALGGKAVGELGIVGVAAAVANAVFHATGKRIRDLPITIEKLIG